MPLFSRVKVWTTKEILTYSDLNAEFDNIINNMAAATNVGYSATVAQMRTQTNPGGVGSESLAASISGELERIRFAISRIIGKTYWYEAPTRSLQSVFSNVSHIFAPPADVDSASSNYGISEFVEAGIYDQAGFNTTDFRSSTAKFSAFSIQNPIANPKTFYLDAGRLNAVSNSYSLWFRNFSSGDTILLNPVLGLRVYLNLNGFIQADLTLQTVTGTAKTVQSVTGSTSLSGLTTFTHLLVTYKAAGAAGDSLSVYINGTLVGTVSTPLAVGLPHKNERVFLMGTNSNRTVVKKYVAGVLPDADGFTLTQTGGASSVSGGILNLDTTAGTQRYYTYTDAARSSPVWLEVKFKLSATGSTFVAPAYTSNQGFLDFFIRASGNQYAAHVSVFQDMITLASASGITSVNQGVEIPHNSTEWTVLTITISSGGTATLYINGVYKAGFSISTDATASTVFGFGKFQATAPGMTGIQIDYASYGTGSFTSGSLNANNSGNQQISDFCAFKGVLSDSTLIASLQNTSPFYLFGPELEKRVKEEASLSMSTNTCIVAAGTAMSIFGVGAGNNNFGASPLFFYSDGKTPIMFNASCSFTSIASAAISALRSSLLMNFSGPGLFTHSIGTGGLDFSSANGISGVPSSPYYISGVAAGAIVTGNISFSHIQVFPPGQWTAYLVHWVTAGGLGVSVNNAKISAYQ